MEGLYFIIFVIGFNRPNTGNDDDNDDGEEEVILEAQKIDEETKYT
jgi:hypothetical protein